MITLLIKGVIWTNEFVLRNDMPNIVEIEVDEDAFETAKEEGSLSDFIKFSIAEDFVFTPIAVKTYRILNKA